MFTPGPWHVGIKQAEQIVYDSRGWAVANATVYHGKSDIQETKDNARLISAAPEMYEALQVFIAACETAPPVELIKYISDACAKAKSAISRIDGE